MCTTSEKSAPALLVETCAQIPEYTVMSGPIFRLPVVKISRGKNSKKKPILLVNFCFLTHFDFSNTRIFSFSIGGKVMNPKMPLCNDSVQISYKQKQCFVLMPVFRSDISSKCKHKQFFWDGHCSCSKMDYYRKE